MWFCLSAKEHNSKLSRLFCSKGKDMHMSFGGCMSQSYSQMIQAWSRLPEDCNSLKKTLKIIKYLTDLISNDRPHLRINFKTKNPSFPYKHPIEINPIATKFFKICLNSFFKVNQSINHSCIVNLFVYQSFNMLVRILSQIFIT